MGCTKRWGWWLLYRTNSSRLVGARSALLLCVRWMSELPPPQTGAAVLRPGVNLPLGVSWPLRIRSTVNAQFCTLCKAMPVLRCLQGSMVHLEVHADQRCDGTVSSVCRGENTTCLGLSFLVHHAFSCFNPLNRVGKDLRDWEAKPWPPGTPYAAAGLWETRAGAVSLALAY